eukprot:4036829-Amphidinium_carterae.1
MRLQSFLCLEALVSSAVALSACIVKGLSLLSRPSSAPGNGRLRAIVAKTLLSPTKTIVLCMRVFVKDEQTSPLQTPPPKKTVNY